MLVEERHQKILELLNTKLSIRTRELEDIFDIGFDTARRDLRLLEQKGLLKRTHGGAVPLFQVGFKAPKTYTPKDIIDIKSNYMAIAVKAVDMIKANDVVYISGASVGYFMTKHLPRDIEFTLVINSIILAEELRCYENITVIVLGGEMTRKGHLRNHFTIEMIKGLRFDVAFVTGAAYSDDFGMSIQSSDGVSFMKAILESSHRSIGLFPHEKIGRHSIMKTCEPDALDCIITDWATCTSAIERIRNLGVDVCIVEEME